MTQNELENKWILKTTLEKLLPIIEKARNIFRNETTDIIDMIPFFELSDRIGCGISFDTFISQLPKKLNTNQKQLLLKYMIEKWRYHPSIQFQKSFQVDTSVYEKEIFLKWFQQNCNRIGKWLSQLDAVEYLKLYPKYWEFFEDIAFLWYMEISYDLKKSSWLLRKFSPVEMERVITAYAKRKEPGAVFFWVMTNHSDLLECISTQPKSDFEKLKKYLAYSPDEKLIFLDLMKDTFLVNPDFRAHLFDSFLKKLDELVESMQALNFQLVSKKIIEDTTSHSQEYKNIFHQVSLQNTTKTPISVVFRSAVSWETNTLILQDSELYQLTWPTESVQIHRSKSDFLLALNAMNEKYSQKLDGNEPFSILYFKMNGKHNTPGNSIQKNFQIQAANQDQFNETNKAA